MKYDNVSCLFLFLLYHFFLLLYTVRCCLKSLTHTLSHLALSWHLPPALFILWRIPYLLIALQYNSLAYIECLCHCEELHPESLDKIYKHYLRFVHKGLLKLQCLIHTDSSIIIITFIFLADIQHSICQKLIFPRSIFCFQIVVKCLPGNFKYSAIKRNFALYLAVFSFDCNKL